MAVSESAAVSQRRGPNRARKRQTPSATGPARPTPSRKGEPPFPPTERPTQRPHRRTPRGSPRPGRSPIDTTDTRGTHAQQEPTRSAATDPKRASPPRAPSSAAGPHAATRNNNAPPPPPPAQPPPPHPKPAPKTHTRARNSSQDGS